MPRLGRELEIINYTIFFYQLVRLFFNSFQQWLCSPPDKIPGLTSYILSRLEPVDTAHDERSTYRSKIGITFSHNISGLSSLEKLLTEIISQIVSNLQTISALRLHRCSKTLAGHIPLNQSFWREQLVTGDLVEYLWDLEPKECHLKDSRDADRIDRSWDWKSLAKMLVSAQVLEETLAQLIEGGPAELHSHHTSLSPADSDITMPDAPIGLKNRCRLIRIIRDIERLDEIEVKDPTIVEHGQLVVPQRLSLNSGQK